MQATTRSGEGTVGRTAAGKHDCLRKPQYNSICVAAVVLYLCRTSSNARKPAGTSASIMQAQLQADGNLGGERVCISKTCAWQLHDMLLHAAEPCAWHDAVPEHPNSAAARVFL
jgi:hypothetical protein